ADARERVVPVDRRAGRGERLGERVERGVAVDGERRVRLRGRREVALDADVQLLGTAGEPGAAARGQLRRLLERRQAEQAAVDPARLVLGAGRGGDLHVVETGDHPSRRLMPNDFFDARWYAMRRAGSTKPATYRCPLCGNRLPALSEHLLVFPDGDHS